MDFNNIFSCTDDITLNLSTTFLLNVNMIIITSTKNDYKDDDIIVDNNNHNSNDISNNIH